MNSASKSIEVINRIIDNKIAEHEDDKDFYKKVRAELIVYANKGVDFSGAINFVDLLNIEQKAFLKEVVGIEWDGTIDGYKEGEE